MEIKTTSPRQTIKFARDFAKSLKTGDTLAIFGDLGAGKTVFVKGLAQGLGIKRRILSPTFIFLRSYPLTINHKPLTFNHIDLYRGEKLTDFDQLGLDEIFSKNSITVIEWPERLEGKLPSKRIEIKIEKKDEKTREITIKRY